MDIKNNTDKDKNGYSFLQEKIVPKTKNSKKKRIYHITMMILYGVIFGLVSSVSFHIAGLCFEKNESPEEKNIMLEHNTPTTLPPETVTAPSPDINENEVKSELDDDELANIFDIASYKKVYTVMNQISGKLKYSMVTVVSYQNVTNWLELENTKSSYGLIVADDDDNIYVVCSYKKIENNHKIKVRFFNDEIMIAEICGYDKSVDLGILKVEKKQISKVTASKITKAVMGDSYRIHTGMPVFALGAPNGYMYSVLRAYVTDPQVDKFITDGKLELFHTDINTRLEGTGFFVNMSGQVIGLISHDYKEDADSEIMSFIGISRLRPMIEDIINGRRKTYFGIKACDLTSEQAKAFNGQYGIYITEVIADSPAFKQGIKSGDVITKIEGTGISSVAAFSSILRTYEPGDKISIGLTRQSKNEYPKVSFQNKTVDILLGKK